MKKIGIITLCGNNNYGNKLQNYAIINQLKKLNFDPETIWIESPYIGSNIKQLYRIVKKRYNDYIKFYKRRKYFLRFNKNLKIRKKLIFDTDFKKVNKKYDFFIVGSDQVWNYNFFNNDAFYLLTESTKTNISLSASFGVDKIPFHYYDRYKKGLNNFDYISVREDKGKEIVENITNKKNIEVLIDPTMLLSSDEWNIVVKKPKQIKNSKYILNYFLGDLSKKRKKEIEKIAKEHDCIVINILDKNEPMYNTGPSEFLYLEKNAFLICTDSFHSCVFAILFDRPFIVFDREQNGVEDMSSRIDTLLDKFKLQDRRYSGKITEENLKHDYTEAYKILEKEREKSLNFLKKALDIEE